MTEKTGRSFVLYGANGYTGRLIADVAIAQGLKPVLAGRNAAAIETMARELGCESLVFSLEDPVQIAGKLAPFRALVLAAGPFSATSAPALEACVRARTSYLDITGEIAVFAAAFARNADAVAAGIAVLPGVGFDVVPSDCLAASLAAKLPGAERLELAFRGGRYSPGTMKTMIEGFSKGGAARVDGKVVSVPSAWKTKTIPFPDKPRLAMTIPWGDVFTAYLSTGIPNIEVYMAVGAGAIAASKRMNLLAPLLGLSPVQSFLKWRVGKSIHGPGPEERARDRSMLWGRVVKGAREVTGTLDTLEGYTLTAETTVASLKRVLEGAVKPGAHTPSQAFGAGFIETIRATRLSIGEPVS
jgi:short subunit dehydrogenase-like uncharacterized protein